MFVLGQDLALYDTFQRQIESCDKQIEAYLKTLVDSTPEPEAPLPAARSRRRTHRNEPHFDVRTTLHHLLRTDLSQIDGIGPYSALRLVSEIGKDMSRWPTAANHFTSWTTLAPQNKISGGRVLSSRTQPSGCRTAAILRMAAMSVGPYPDRARRLLP